MLLLLLPIPLLAAAGTGSYHPVAVEQLVPGGHVSSLSAFAINQLRAQSNSLDVQQHLNFLSVLSAQMQVVAGSNYRVTVRLSPTGTAELSIHEQPWTSTLQLVTASYSPSDVSFAMVELVPSSSPLTLDYGLFTTFAAREAARHLVPSSPSPSPPLLPPAQEQEAGQSNATDAPSEGRAVVLVIIGVCVVVCIAGLVAGARMLRRRARRTARRALIQSIVGDSTDDIKSPGPGSGDHEMNVARA
jgi:hypothetical protein